MIKEEKIETFSIEGTDKNLFIVPSGCGKSIYTNIMYSEEEVRRLCKESFKVGGIYELKPFTTDFIDIDSPCFDEWFEQNKKK